MADQYFTVESYFSTNEFETKRTVMALLPTCPPPTTVMRYISMGHFALTCAIVTTLSDQQCDIALIPDHPIGSVGQPVDQESGVLLCFPTIGVLIVSIDVLHSKVNLVELYLQSLHFLLSHVSSSCLCFFLCL